MAMLNVRGLPQLRAVAAAYAHADTETRTAIRAEAKTFGPILQREAIVRASSRGKVEMAIAQSGKITANNHGLIATFGSTGQFRGESLRNLAAPFEFGGNRDKWETYLSRHRISRRAIRVTRRAQRQLPEHRRTGWFIHPAVADTAPTLVGMWVRAIAGAVQPT